MKVKSFSCRNVDGQLRIHFTWLFKLLCIVHMANSTIFFGFSFNVFVVVAFVPDNVAAHMMFGHSVSAQVKGILKV